MDHIPRKRFGQHFLCDQTVIQQIVAAIHPKADEHLIEIGPGQGALTLPILKQTRQLEAIELDRDLIAELNERCRHHGDLRVYQQDVLEVDFATLKQDKRMLRVFGNLPYNISTPLLFHLLDYSDKINDMVFMLQKEVADRLAAKPATADYGRLSVMVQYHCEVEKLFDVSPQAFYPPPQVYSSIIQLLPYKTLPVRARDYAVFEKVVKQAFGQRRKTLRNSLKSLVNDGVWEKISIHSDLRPEELAVKDFVEISNEIT